jgi:lipopolysaccharide export system permease protein
MKILRNYILKEFFGPLFLCLGVLTFVMTLIGNLKRIAELVINKGVDIFSVIQIFFYLTPYIVTYTLPISILVAVLLALGRLSGDNEIIAIRSSGISIFKLMVPLLIVGLIASLALALFNDRAASYSHFAYRKALQEMGIKNPTAAFEEGVFIDSFKRYILFIYNVDQKKNRLNNIRIYEPQGDDRPTRTIVAKAGEFIAIPGENAIKLKLIDGTSDEPDPENPTNFYKLNFRTYFMNLDIAQMQNKVVEKKYKEMTIQELRKEAAKLNAEGISPAPIITKIHEKLSLAFSCFAFMLLGSSLGIITRRRERTINIGIAVLIIVCYYPLYIGLAALAMEGVLPAALALWLPNIIFAGTGAFLTYKLCAS